MNKKLDVSLSYEDEIPILSLEGKLTSMQQDKFFQVYQEISQEKVGKVIIDFQKTEYVNSSGISVLIQLIKDGELKQRSFIFAGLNPHLCRVFDAVGFSDIIPIYSTIEEAIQS